MKEERLTFEAAYNLMLAVTEERAAKMPADIPESERLAWVLIPFRDWLQDQWKSNKGLSELLTELEEYIEAIQGDGND